MPKPLEQIFKNPITEPKDSLENPANLPGQPLLDKPNQKILNYCQNLENLLN